MRIEESQRKNVREYLLTFKREDKLGKTESNKQHIIKKVGREQRNFALSRKSSKRLF